MSKDPYQILKVHPSAKLEEIKKAYRKLVKIHHPDKGGDSAVMLEVNSAWEILKKKHKDLNLNQVNNSKLYNQNEYKRETNNHSKPEDLKNVSKILEKNSVYHENLGVIIDKEMIINEKTKLTIDELKSYNTNWLKNYMSA